jgi:hypothetical protein
MKSSSRGAIRLLLAVIVGALGALVLPTATASADPTNHFETFEITCGGHSLVIVSKPGSSNVVTFDGQLSTSVSILKGLTISVDGVVVEEFHKPFTSHQDVTVCTEVSTLGELVVVETILTPRRP